jgi:protein-glucosylgalactosylhydroxylysine glucosidase
LTVGNGGFAFTVDATGLQTFPEAFEETTPLGILSDWGWHSAPNPEGWSIDTFKFHEFDNHGRKVGYADAPNKERTPESEWLRANPHRLHLGQIGFVLRKADGSLATTNDLTDIEHILDLWNGSIRSRFKLEGREVLVETVCHPTNDLVAVRVVSALAREGRLAIQLRFPYATPATTSADWSKPDAHETQVVLDAAANGAVFHRRLDADRYSVRAHWSSGAMLTNIAPHTYRLTAEADADALEFSCQFSPTQVSDVLGDFGSTKAVAAAHWNRLWQTGGAIDLSLSKDPRWRELERRIVLSQYLTAIQCAGDTPPQETGLTYNSWNGKFHLEMHLWHEAQFSLWGRLPLFEKSLGYYQRILPKAQATAKRQGYEGARWPKMTSPSGDESPSPVGPFLVWQPPHPIFYAELCWRQHRDRATLERFREIVEQTAEFMASYANWDEATKRYVLGPPVQCAQERFPKDSTMNPTFELTYWRWALETAQTWRERLGQPRQAKWDRVLLQLAKPVLEQDKYLFAETATGTYTDGKWTTDHPSVLLAFGLLPGPGIDRATMDRTFNWIWPN